MNYQWEKVYCKHSQAENEFGIYETEVEGTRIRIQIYTTLKFMDLNNKRLIHTSVYFETKDEYKANRYFDEVSNDIFELCKEDGQYDSTELFNVCSNEYYCVETLPNEIPYTFGDYSC